MTPFLRGRDGARNRWKLAAAIGALILASVSLAAVKLVVLKMLPFDNKSEFQVVVDMPTGTALEDTSRVLHEIGEYLATVPEVTDYQAYAGTVGADQLQRPGAPVLPARAARARRYPGEPRRQARARPQVARDRGSRCARRSRRSRSATAPP